MKAVITHKNLKYTIDLSEPLDISIPLRSGKENLNAWYLDAPKITPVKDRDWTGSVEQGAAVNFNTITFNPHAHGTHTECVGHITPEFYSVNAVLKQFFCIATVITVTPKHLGMDLVIDQEVLEPYEARMLQADALVIRTLPNFPLKKRKQYSHSNWAYLTEAAALYIREAGIQHLLIDLPSVDKEKDDGKLLAHKAFWNFPKAIRHEATITEFIYVDNEIKDGGYLLNLQIAPFENDAAPGKPILYRVYKVG